jgi:hypothetical protein
MLRVRMPRIATPFTVHVYRQATQCKNFIQARVTYDVIAGARRLATCVHCDVVAMIRSRKRGISDLRLIASSI